MASKCKSPSEVELIAIYRLEFYKNQKNWKFCQDVCKKNALKTDLVPKQNKELKSANSTKSILNKTYDLGSEVASSDLNEAFLEPDPDKIPPVTPPDPINLPSFNNTYKRKLNTTEEKWPQLELQWPESQKDWPEQQKQWPEQQKQWPETQKEWPGEQKQFSESQKVFLEQLKQWPESQKGWLKQGTQWPETQKQWPETQTQWSEPQTQWSEPQTQWPEQDKQWPEATRVWSLPQMPEQGWQNVGQWGGGEAHYPRHGAPPRACEGAGGWPELGAEAPANAYAEQIQPEAVLGAAEDWLRGAQLWPTNEDARSLSSDSAVSFMRGAAAAPHSSEVDLNVSASSAPLSGSAAACLSARQLAVCVGSHAHALRLLLNEVAARAAMAQHRPPYTLDYRTPSAVAPPSPRDERPTRDVDLPLHKDSFVAGSFKNNEPIGRGRGRLHRERLIGIGMGRPYRL